MKTLYTTAASATLILLASAAAAQDEDDKLGWDVSAELGAIRTSGNTEATSLNGKLDVVHKMENWKNQYVASAFYKEDEQEQPDGTEEVETTAEQYFVSAKSAYLFEDEFSNVFAFASHDHDEFGAYRDYTTVSAGYGARLIERETLTLDAEIGPGYYWGDKVEASDTITSEEGFIVRGAGELEWLVSENATFTQQLGVQSSDDNTRYVSDTALATKINGSMQMKVGYMVTHNTDVASDKEKTDTKTYVNLVYTF